MRFLLFAVLLFSLGTVWAQEDNLETAEIFILESFITPDNPKIFILSFFTSDSCKSFLQAEGNNEIPISLEYKENHTLKIPAADLKSENGFMKYKVRLLGKDETELNTETFEVEYPEEVVMEDAPGLFTMFCIGGTIFLSPSVSMVWSGNERNFQLTKEIPVISFYPSKKTYPDGYIGIEYSYIFKAEKSFLRTGYKHIIEIPVIEYISPGIGGFSDLNGSNGISGEIALGLFKMSDVFTLYTRYRYNRELRGEGSKGFSEVSLGLYSSFFSLNF